MGCCRFSHDRRFWLFLSFCSSTVPNTYFIHIHDTHVIISRVVDETPSNNCLAPSSVLCISYIPIGIYIYYIMYNRSRGTRGPFRNCKTHTRFTRLSQKTISLPNAPSCFIIFFFFYFFQFYLFNTLLCNGVSFLTATRWLGGFRHLFPRRYRAQHHTALLCFSFRRRCSSISRARYSILYIYSCTQRVLFACLLIR